MTGLAVEGLVAGYGQTVVLDGLSFSVPAGGSLAVLGRNGVGKTTLLASLMGLTTRHRGSIVAGQTRVERLSTFRRSRLGFGYVPQEREVFPSLSVEENLLISRRARGWPLDRIYALFPGLAARRRSMGGRLSGGEQQMLSIGRALVGGPGILLLDEPMEGLAPVMVDALYDALRSLRGAAGLTIILVEQKAELALQLAERAIVLDRGRIVHEGPSAVLLSDAALQAGLLGVNRQAVRDVRPAWQPA